MFFILSKTLHFLLMPLLWVLVLLLLAIFLKSPRKKKVCLAAGAGLLLLLSNPFLANEAWRAWEVEATPVSEINNYDAALILTGVTGYREDLPDRILTHKGADRFLHPLQLYRMNKVNLFVVTGGNSSVLLDNIPEAEQIERILLMGGVPEEDILTESNSRNTRENALHTAELLKKHPEWKRLLLVTSAFHMRRSLACFQKAGVEVTPFSTDFYASPRRFTPDETIIPDAGAFSGWHLLIHEIAGYLIYKILGYC
ncbi:YdcF family protein [Pontibacter sp. SGAir0037]|nr:YdcF family protein [Pontibacter sp. SGAir0037]